MGWEVACGLVTARDAAVLKAADSTSAGLGRGRRLTLAEFDKNTPRGRERSDVSKQRRPRATRRFQSEAASVVTAGGGNPLGPGQEGQGVQTHVGDTEEGEEEARRDAGEEKGGLRRCAERYAHQ